MAETGARSRRLMLERLRLGRPFSRAFGKAPFLVPLSAQSTSAEPFKALYASLPSLETGEVLGIDIASGFPPADIYECGPAVVAYGREEADVRRAFDQVLGCAVGGGRPF